MNNVFDRVRSLAAKFTPGKFVTVDESVIPAVAEELKRRQAATAPGTRLGTSVAILGDLLLGAVNYCYWYGRSDVYPAGEGAVAMHKIVGDSLDHIRDPFLDNADIALAVRRVQRGVVFSGMPLADRRHAHLREIEDNPKAVREIIESIRLLHHSGGPIDGLVTSLNTSFPGYSGDPFLKRALLFFHMLHRDYGLFSREQVQAMPIPTDYQVPKYLRHFGVLKYSPELAAMVDGHQQIPAASLPEIEIRAATIVAADKLATASGLTTGQIDGILWGARKEVKSPFHLTVTTDY